MITIIGERLLGSSDSVIQTSQLIDTCLRLCQIGNSFCQISNGGLSSLDGGFGRLQRGQKRVGIGLGLVSCNQAFERRYISTSLKRSCVISFCRCRSSISSDIRLILSRVSLLITARIVERLQRIISDSTQSRSICLISSSLSSCSQGTQTGKLRLNLQRRRERTLGKIHHNHCICNILQSSLRSSSQVEVVDRFLSGSSGFGRVNQRSIRCFFSSASIQNGGDAFVSRLSNASFQYQLPIFENDETSDSTVFTYASNISHVVSVVRSNCCSQRSLSVGNGFCSSFFCVLGRFKVSYRLGQAGNRCHISLSFSKIILRIGESSSIGFLLVSQQSRTYASRCVCIIAINQAINFRDSSITTCDNLSISGCCFFAVYLRILGIGQQESSLSVLRRCQILQTLSKSELTRLFRSLATNLLNNSIHFSLSRNSSGHASEEVTSGSDVSFVVLNVFNSSGEQVSSFDLVTQGGGVDASGTVDHVQGDGGGGELASVELLDVPRLAFGIGSTAKGRLVDGVDNVTDGVGVDVAIQSGSFSRGGEGVDDALQTLSFYLLRPVLTAGEVCRALIKRDVEFLYGFKLISDSHVNLLGY